MPLETIVLCVDGTHPTPWQIEQAAQVIQNGGLVAFPTETVYGLGADALNQAAVARIFEAKRRPAADPIIAHVCNQEMVSRLAASIPEVFSTLSTVFWPGPLTLILPRRDSVPANLSAGMSTVAVRMPNLPAALALIQAAGTPIAAPSANLFSRPSATSAAHVLADLGGRIDMILDAGSTLIGVESTVLDLTQVQPTILRPGGVSIEALRPYLPDVVVSEHWLNEEQAGSSPGMMTKHYSPMAQVLLFDGETPAVLGAIRETLEQSKQSAGVLLSDDDLSTLGSAEAYRRSLGNSAEEAARQLFDAFRQFDAEGVEVILARLPTFPDPLNAALRDRLLRSAEGRVQQVD